MSENVLRFFPTDPYHVPDEAFHSKAVELLRSRFPHSDAVTLTVEEEPIFVDQGANFERVICPSCGADLDLDWWSNEMTVSAEGNFADLEVTLPCCQVETSLNDLQYDWPAGFARFVLDVRSPGRPLADADLLALQQTLACPMRAIWSHV